MWVLNLFAFNKCFSILDVCAMSIFLSSFYACDYGLQFLECGSQTLLWLNSSIPGGPLFARSLPLYWSAQWIGGTALINIFFVYTLRTVGKGQLCRVLVTPFHVSLNSLIFGLCYELSGIFALLNFPAWTFRLSSPIFSATPLPCDRHINFEGGRSGDSKNTH